MIDQLTNSESSFLSLLSRLYKSVPKRRCFARFSPQGRAIFVEPICQKQDSVGWNSAAVFHYMSINRSACEWCEDFSFWFVDFRSVILHFAEEFQPTLLGFLHIVATPQRIYTSHAWHAPVFKFTKHNPRPNVSGKSIYLCRRPSRFVQILYKGHDRVLRWLKSLRMSRRAERCW